MDTKQLDRLRTAITTAQRTWTGADWTHYFIRGGVPVMQPSGVLVECGGWTACDTCQRARIDAAHAQHHGDRARWLLADGDYAAALDRIRSARHLEQQWGDTPTWGPVAELAAQLVEDTEDK